jgi:cytochrome c oxidase assembly protein subunit 15
MKGGVFYEHGHRMVASGVGFLTIVMAIWLWVADPRKWMKWLGVAALAAVIIQGVLGGMTVLFLLPKAVSISHACLAQLFFSTTVAIALFTSRSWTADNAEYVEDAGWPSMRTLAVITPVLTLAQIALGAAYRHRALSVLPHIVGALVVAAFILMVAIFLMAQFGSHRALKRAAVWIISITSVQVLLGIAAYMARASTIDAVVPVTSTVYWTIAHVAMGAITMAASVVLCIEVLRNVRGRVVVESGGVPVASR